MAVQPASPAYSNNNRATDEVVDGRLELGNLESRACSMQSVIGLSSGRMLPTRQDLLLSLPLLQCR